MMQELLRVFVFFFLLCGLFSCMWMIENRGFQKGIDKSVECVVDLNHRAVDISAKELNIWIKACANEQ